MDSFQTFKQFQTARKKFSFTGFLFKLHRSDCFDEDRMSQLFPGLREVINHNRSNVDAQQGSVAAMCSPCAESNSNGNKKKGPYQQIEQFLTAGTEEHRLRLDTTQPHVSTPIPKDAKDGRCILCCEFCARGKCKVGPTIPVVSPTAVSPSEPNAETAAASSSDNVANKKTPRTAYSRMGRKSRKYCSTCKVTICKHCHDIFHSEQVSLPPCSPFQHLIPRSSRSVATPTSATSDVVKSTRPNRTTRVTPTALPTTGARAAEEANVTSPNRMQRQKKMRESRGSPRRVTRSAANSNQNNPVVTRKSARNKKKED